jgi:hypothetical protein
VSLPKPIVQIVGSLPSAPYAAWLKEDKQAETFDALVVVVVVVAVQTSAAMEHGTQTTKCKWNMPLL